MTILFFTVCFMLQFVVSYGMLVGHHQSKYKKITREDAGQIVLFTFIAGILPGLGLLLIFCMTGFAQGGLKYVNPFKLD